MPLLRDAHAREPESEYFARWQLVYTLASLEQREALTPLAHIALSSLPPEKGDSPEVSTVGLDASAVRGYLAVGPEYEARVRTLRAALPPRDHGLITLISLPPFN